MRRHASEVKRGTTANAVVFAACGPDELDLLLAQIPQLDRARAVVIAFDPLPRLDHDPPVSMQPDGLPPWRAVRLWITALMRPFTLVAVCVGRDANPKALRALVAFAATIRTRVRQQISLSEAPRPIPGVNWRDLLAIVPLRVQAKRMRRQMASGSARPGQDAPSRPLLAAAGLLTRVGLLTMPRHAPRRRTPGGKFAVLVPIVPDLSHTFVYREVAELRKRHSDIVVIGLEHGDATVLHDVAAEVLQHTEFLPRLSPTAYLRRYLISWLRSSLRMATTEIRRVRPHTSSFGPAAIPNDSLAFLRIEYIDYANYVIKGLVLADFLRARGVGYVHVYGFTYPALRMLIAQDLTGIPFSLSTFVDFDYDTPFHMAAEKLSSARFVVACTAYCAVRLEARWPETRGRTRVLHHAVPIDIAAGAARRPDDGSSRLVFVGRFVPKKGLDVLVAACATLRDRGVRFTCRLYGAGETREAVHAQIASLGLEGVVFDEGPLPNQRFYSVMNDRDVFVCPSRYMPDGERDGIPVTLLEAMAGGITVVSTAVSGIPELIEDGVSGYLVPPNDPAALAARLEHVLGDDTGRASVRESALRTVSERFELSRTVATLDEWITRERASAF